MGGPEPFRAPGWHVCSGRRGQNCSSNTGNPGKESSLSIDLLGSQTERSLLMQLFNWLKKGLLTLITRLQTQGLRVTLLWLYARGLPILTGIPVMKYSRISPNIYVGPQFRQSGKRKLEALKISASLNLRAEFDDRVRHLELRQHCYLPTEDDHAPDFGPIGAGDPIYSTNRRPRWMCVHPLSWRDWARSNHGGRIPDRPGCHLDEAICMIKKTRPFIKIMPLQMQRLTQFETIKRTGT